MVNTGSTALPYQPYGYKIPILSGGTTTPVYLGEVESTRQIYKLELKGNENITQHSVKNGVIGVRIPTSTNVKGTSDVICSHCTGGVWTTYNGVDRPYNIIVSNPADGNAILYMTAPDSEHNTLQSLVQWISDQYTNGTPVRIWYIQQTATTITLNEPIRKIGNYADSVSVTGIPTTGTAEQFDVQTDLKPSEVDLTYHGWHEHEPKEYSGGSWT